MPTVTVSPVSPVVLGETSKQSEQASLHGYAHPLLLPSHCLTTSHRHRALTPMISGVVSGGTIGILWIVGLLIYIYRRYRGHQQVRAAGLRNHRELAIPPPKPEAYILPPDPAIIMGFRVPGERVVSDDPRTAGDGKLKHARTEPLAQSEKGKAPEKRPGEPRSAPELPTLKAHASPEQCPPTLPTVQNRLSPTRSLSPRNTRPPRSS